MSRGYVADIKQKAKENENYREVLYTAKDSQVVLMSLRPGEDIGLEVHDGDQVLYFVAGAGFVVLDDVKHDVGKGSIAVVPAGVRHKVVNTGPEAMKLFTVYAPPQHAAGLVQPVKGADSIETRGEETWPEEAAPDADYEKSRSSVGLGL